MAKIKTMKTKFVTKILICDDCKQEFVYTGDAQEYLNGKGFKHNPKRCKRCHIAYINEKRLKNKLGGD